MWIYLLEKFYDEILGNKLPSKAQILGVYLHNIHDLKKPVDELNQIKAYWNKARISIQEDHKIKPKIIQTVSELEIIGRTATQKE